MRTDFGVLTTLLALSTAACFGGEEPRDGTQAPEENEVSQLAACAGTPITPYLRVGNGAWQQTASQTIMTGDSVQFGPQPNSGGAWSWSGCSTSGNSREQTKTLTGSCTATATYQNTCGASSSQQFTITATFPNCASAASDPDGDGWGWENNKSCKVVASSTGGTANGTPNCTTNTSDPDGDGWGWENNKSCVVVEHSAMQITGDMGVGWNLGNSLDASGSETAWGNPKTTQAMIDTVKNAGFHSLRIPVSWDSYLSGSNYTIASSFLDRVEEIANYGLSDNMYVIVNIHHNNGWEAPTTNNEANSRDHLQKIWQQIATRFNKYGDRVIFETMNEPRNGEDWTGNQSNYDVLNRLNAAALSTIRNTGGNNRKRLVMIPGYAASAGSQIYAISLPNDSKYAISTHAYYPFSFALDQYGTATFNTAEVDDLFNRLNSTFISKGIPVVMGEWASTNKNNLSERVKHAQYYVAKAKAVKIPTLWWDNNNATANTGDAMGLLNRSNNTWYFPTIVSAIMNGNR